MTPKRGIQHNNYKPTEAQREILNALIEGFDNQGIANATGRAYKTIKNHISDLLKATGLKNRTALALWWMWETSK